MSSPFNSETLKIKRFFYLFVVITMGMIGFPRTGWTQNSLEETQEQIRKMERELASSRERLSRLRKEKATLLAQVQTLDEQEQILERILSNLRTQENLLDSRIARISREITRLDSTLEAAVDQMIAGMVLLYKWPRHHALMVIFSAQDLYDAFSALKAADAVLTYNERLYHRAVEVQDSLEYFRDLRRRRLADLRLVRQQFESRRAELAATRKEKRRLHAQLSQKEKDELARIQRLEQTLQELENLVQKILKEEEERRKRAQKVRGLGKPLAGRKLIWPVASDRVVSTFGIRSHPKYKTRTKNNGIDIDAGSGAFVRAVDQGEVVYSDEFLEYGGLIIIDHGSFYSLYANLGKRLVRKGEEVRQGDVIGSVDRRGILHFELRIGGRPVNPLHYLP